MLKIFSNKFCARMSSLLTLVILFAVLGYFIGVYMQVKPIDSSLIAEELVEEPLQGPTSEPPFVLSYEGKDFQLIPRATYEFSGLVVSHNDITSLFDSYHDSSSEDVKDICVIWGSNVQNNFFHQLKFWSEPWTCFVQGVSCGDRSNFDMDALGNNHLLVADEELRREIMSVRKWDQVYVSGLLVDYHPVGRPQQVRATSLVRTDTGQGACEVVFVDDFLILSRGNETWHYLRIWSTWISLLGLVAKAFFSLLPLYRI